ncbi:Hsp20/alpha crystallin family protein [Fundidesulfovibrio soli]|uniref:Hsp20/alpha crystallin family protein n=1 Tax=Fundidesulfovibrio soli TaxID=2922716 RepID=UPI001FAF893D|nr:Hsp20/alpha crystallin family protein [Fundidesulfovibrio soli]
MFKDFLPSLRRQSLATKRPTSIADLMEDFWREPFGNFPAMPFSKEARYPAVDISETDAEIQVKAELPGLEPKDVNVTLQNDVLTIQGEKKFEEEEKKENYHRIERSYGSFFRSIPLPSAVKDDGVTAKFDKGVLTVTLPKREPSKSTSVPIQS